MLYSCFMVLISVLVACNTDSESELANSASTAGVDLNTINTDAQLLPPGSQALPPISPMGSGVYTQPPPDSNRARSVNAICSDCDIVLVTVCSLRKDHVSLFAKDIGDIPAARTPFIDSIADKGYAFSRTISASNFTLAGLTAILTGRFGSGTGVTGWNKGLTKNIPTLPEVLGIYGYQTAAFTIDSASGFRPEYGLNRGFQTMTIFPPPAGTPDGRAIAGKAIEGSAAIPLAKWLQSAPKNKPLFAMFHSRTAHFPFVVDNSKASTDPTGISALLYQAGGQPVSPEEMQAMPGMAGGVVNDGVTPGSPDPLHQKVAELGEPAVAAWKARYKEAVERMDKDLKITLEAIKTRGRPTIVVLVSDHGESLYDHEELLHGDGFYDSVVNVPLLMNVPGLSGQVSPISALTSHVDILPTLLELVGAVSPANIDGHSMLPLMTGQSDSIRAIALSEGGVARHDSGDPPGAVFAPPWAMLRQRRGCDGGMMPPNQPGPPNCLYNMDRDPKQRQNLTMRHPEVIDRLLGVWRQYRQDNQQSATTLSLSPEFIQTLQKTGYDFR